MTLTWYMPSWNGDFRLEPIESTYRERGSDKCQLVIQEPTVDEQRILQKFLTHAIKQGWSEREEMRLQGEDLRDVVPLSCSMADAGKKLVALTKPRESTITAFRYENGRVEVAEQGDAKAISDAADKAEKSPEKVKGASVKRPTPCCPQCFRDAIGPATDVLLSFLDEEQHRHWRDYRAVICYGGRSGHRYLLAHRNSAIAERIGKICFDITDGGVMHFHDWSVPPEEEVLAAMLILQYREPWLRNEATCLGGLRDDVYHNPFGDASDGTWDTAFTSGFGRGFLGSV